MARAATTSGRPGQRRPAGGPGDAHTAGGGSQSVAAVERACDVLNAICADVGRPKGVKDVSETLGMGMSSVHRLLTALVNKGLVRQDAGNKKYSVGPRLLDVALEYLRHIDLPKVALPHMQRLRDVTGETVTLSVRDGDSRIYLAQIESPQEIRQTVEIGRRMPLHLGGSGKAILGFLPETEQEAYLNRPDLVPAVDGPVDIKALRRQLLEVRRRGFASSRAERLPNAASVAAPIHDVYGALVGCLSVSGPVWRFSDERIAEYGGLVVNTADEVSRCLGFVGNASAKSR